MLHFIIGPARLSHLKFWLVFAAFNDFVLKANVLLLVGLPLPYVDYCQRYEFLRRLRDRTEDHLQVESRVELAARVGRGIDGGGGALTITDG